jgi:cupredoxin-like protein
MTGRIFYAVWLFLLLVFAAESSAGTEPEYVIKIAHHQFVPAELHIPRGIKVRIVLDNQDDTAEEFDSHSLNREKHVPPKSQAVIFIGPLAPGRYIYEGESEVAGGPALGVIVVE